MVILSVLNIQDIQIDKPAKHFQSAVTASVGGCTFSEVN